jgi:hypothetical protein
VCWKLRDRQGRGTSLLNYTVLHPNPTNKLVKTHFAPFWCWDKPRAILDSLDSPRLGLGGSHHLPPYSILCSSPPHLHPNGSFSRDSQSGVPKLSRFGLLGLWTFITSRPELGSEQGLNQSCSSPQAFQWCVTLYLHAPESGWFPTFSGRESNWQFDSRPFFRP